MSDPAKILSEDDWSWLYWCLGHSAGCEAQDETATPQRKEPVFRRSVELVNKLGELREAIERKP